MIRRIEDASTPQLLDRISELLATLDWPTGAQWLFSGRLDRGVVQGIPGAQDTRGLDAHPNSDGLTLKRSQARRIGHSSAWPQAVTARGPRGKQTTRMPDLL